MEDSAFCPSDRPNARLAKRTRGLDARCFTVFYLVFYLASSLDAASYMTGVTLHVNGGLATTHTEPLCGFNCRGIQLPTYV